VSIVNAQIQYNLKKVGLVFVIADKNGGFLLAKSLLCLLILMLVVLIILS
jgi:DNA-binding IscR family transcriptional regulator